MKLSIIVPCKNEEGNITELYEKINETLDKLKYDITPVYIDKMGDWYLYTKDINDIEILKIGEEPIELQQIENPIKVLKNQDVIFPVLHGLYGEDGTIQGMLELLKIPYVGCGIIASSIGMDKSFTKIIFEKAKINQTKHIYIKDLEEDKVPLVEADLEEKKINLQEVISITNDKLNFPLFIKPCNSGSSVGVNKAENNEELKNAILEAFKYLNGSFFNSSQLISLDPPYKTGYLCAAFNAFLAKIIPRLAGFLDKLLNI